MALGASPPSVGDGTGPWGLSALCRRRRAAPCGTSSCRPLHSLGESAALGPGATSWKAWLRAVRLQFFPYGHHQLLPWLAPCHPRQGKQNHLLSIFFLCKSSVYLPATIVGKNNLIMNNPNLILRKSILTKNDAITQHK
jgi:hypothetical protein